MKERILNKNYAKTFKIIIILFIVLALVSGVAIPLSLHTQIREKVAYEAQYGEEHHHEEEHHENQQQESQQIDRPKANITPLSAVNYIIIGLFGAMWCVLVLYYWLMVVAWLYKSALKEGMNRSLWPILGVFFNIFAVMAFVIIRDEPKRTAHS